MSSEPPLPTMPEENPEPRPVASAGGSVMPVVVVAESVLANSAADKSVRYGTIAMVAALPAIMLVWQTIAVAGNSWIPDWFIGIFIGNVVAFGSLLAFWTALGGRPLPWRLVATAGLMAMAGRFFFRGDSAPDNRFIMMFELFGSGGVLLVEGILFWLLRWFGLELEFLAESRRDWHRGRYSLGYLFQWMAAVAVLSAIFTWLPAGENFQWIRPVLEFLVIGVVGGVPSLLLTLAVLGRRQRWMLRAGIALLLLTVVFVVLMVLNSAPPTAIPEGIVYFGSIFATLAFWHLLVLYPLRRIGYRLVWRARREF